ncbi:MAG: hypothetical protein WBA74_21320 [Cyclobacteriaceae bacterium]
MEENEKYIALLIGHLEKRLDETERKEFDKLLSSSEDFRKELLAYSSVDAALKANGRLKRREMIKDTFAAFDEKQKPKQDRTITMQRSLGIAASIVGLVVAGIVLFSNQQRSSGEIYVQYYEVFPIDGGNVRNSDDLPSEGLDLYMKGRYIEAIPYLEELIERDSSTINSIYLANAYMNSDQFAKAEVNLKNVDTGQQNTVLSRYRKWYLTLTLLEKGKNRGS